jgi:hypothetical protein
MSSLLIGRNKGREGNPKLNKLKMVGASFTEPDCPDIMRCKIPWSQLNGMGSSRQEKSFLLVVARNFLSRTCMTNYRLHLFIPKHSEELNIANIIFFLRILASSFTFFCFGLLGVIYDIPKCAVSRKASYSAILRSARCSISWRNFRDRRGHTS